MKTKSKQKEVSKKPNQKNGKGKDKKIEDSEEEEKEIEEIPKEKPYNLERFIYITDYNNNELMTSLKKLFEEINQKAFDLLSTKEIYSRNLTESERDNNEIDYISGFQLIDKAYRITILEGITGLGIKKVKETLPKTNLNNKNLKIFSNSKILFNKRIYSKFNLCLKYIKLSRNLQNILQTYEIYEKAKNSEEAYHSDNMPYPVNMPQPIVGGSEYYYEVFKALDGGNQIHSLYFTYTCGEDVIAQNATVDIFICDENNKNTNEKCANKINSCTNSLNEEECALAEATDPKTSKCVYDKAEKVCKEEKKLCYEIEDGATKDICSSAQVSETNKECVFVKQILAMKF